MNITLNNEKGGAIAQVVILTTAISILITVLLATQYKAPLRYPIQALSNARAALIKELNNPDQAPQVFEAKKETTTLDSAAIVEPLWKDSIFGDATITKTPSPFFLTYTVTGYCKKDTALIEAKCGSTIRLGDTTLVIANKNEIEGVESISGEIVAEDSSSIPQKFRINTQALSESKKATDSLFLALDSISPGPTINIFQEKDFAAMGTTIGGDLFIDGTNITIDGKDSTFTILGDLQLTGKVTLKNGTFIIGGEVRSNDQCTLEDAELFIKKRLFLSHETVTSANIISYGAVEILDNATVKDKSLLISFNKAKKEKSAINIRGNSKVNATLFSSGSILTEMDTETTGILYSQSAIIHAGYHSGLVVCNTLGHLKEEEKSDKENKPQPDTPKDSLKITNKLEGTITDIFNPDSYPLPWFIGSKTIVSWREFR